MTSFDARVFDLAECIRLACQVEAFCEKAGNVHPRASFSDLTHADFVLAADLIAPSLSQSGELGVGRAILEAVGATRAAMETNPNLGIVLLIAPLAAVPMQTPISEGIDAVLASLTVEDATLVYEAIRLARPGGLGQTSEQDVSDTPTETLRSVMCRAADRDQVAAQYCNGFQGVLDFAVPRLKAGADFVASFETEVQTLQLALLANFGDSLIARKCGPEIAAEASRRAGHVLEAGWPNEKSAQLAWSEYDRWLRADGHRRNPGATADLIAAALFVGFREGVLPRVMLPE